MLLFHFNFKFRFDHFVVILWKSLSKLLGLIWGLKARYEQSLRLHITIECCCISSLGLFLLSHELGVDAFRVLFDQSLMSAYLHNLALVHYNDLIRVLDCRESVSHDHSCN